MVYGGHDCFLVEVVTQFGMDLAKNSHQMNDRLKERVLSWIFSTNPIYQNTCFPLSKGFPSVHG
jgi:hypothetical protein